jgi:predicted nucleic acid-binding protein
VGPVVLDSSVLIAIFDPRDAHHRTTLATLKSGFQAGLAFSVPASVLSEVLVGAARHSEEAAAARRRDIERLFPTRIIDDAVAVAAAHLRARHRSLRLPDALVIATGIVDNAEKVLTADKRWSGLDERVHVLST